MNQDVGCWDEWASATFARDDHSQAISDAPGMPTSWAAERQAGDNNDECLLMERLHIERLIGVIW